MDLSAKIKRTELPEDLVLEVLTRVANAAALVRCATACKRWRALAANPSFVRRRHQVLMGRALVADPIRRRHQVLMAVVSVYDGEWALCKVLRHSDVDPTQNRLLLTTWMGQGGPILMLFPELEQVGDNGMQNEVVEAVLIDAEWGVEKLATVRYMNANMTYRIIGRGWREFVRDCRISHGDRVDIYVGRRDTGERCLLFFNSKGAQG
uniref:Uncharacterized protein n=1 Tax=Aegilops tauschii TaxID=37682 RepID=M8B347_AEGTA